MAISPESRRGRFALMLAHCAGMVDLVALSVWVGALTVHYGFDPQQAGSLPTLFLAGAVLASVMLAPRIGSLNGRWLATVGYAAAAAAFWTASQVTDYAQLAALHGVAGIAAGAGLSVTHGTIARSANPHRLFALVGLALGVFAVAFLAGVPQLIAVQGGPALFRAFSAVMAAGALAAALVFPASRTADAVLMTSMSTPNPMPAVVWFGIVGISCMTLVQSMTFSFLEGVGLQRGFERAAINGVLIALGLVNLLPPALAALLQRSLAPRKVLLAGPGVQCVMAGLIMLSPAFGGYAVGGALLAAVMIFTHTFAFGLLASLDRSGRALTGTPAMLMVGSAIGPFLGGTLVAGFGYESLALAAACLAVVATFCFSRLPRGSGAIVPAAE